MAGANKAFAPYRSQTEACLRGSKPCQMAGLLFALSLKTHGLFRTAHFCDRVY